MAKADFTRKDRHKNADVLIKGALKALKRELKQPKTDSLCSPQAVKSYLQLELAREEREVFCVMFLDAQNRLIEFERLSKGTLMTTQVHPREVARSALKHNAAAVILAHNHPTGSVEESKSDRQLTSTLQQTLALFEVKVLDHIIIAGNESKSFSEHGLI
jgi:DNA repair protein RadC